MDERKKKKNMNDNGEEVLMSLNLEVVDCNAASLTDDYSAVYSSVDEGAPGIFSHCSVTRNSLKQQVLCVPLIMTV